jgi:hypothetical protein
LKIGPNKVIDPILLEGNLCILTGEMMWFTSSCRNLLGSSAPGQWIKKNPDCIKKGKQFIPQELVVLLFGHQQQLGLPRMPTTARSTLLFSVFPAPLSPLTNIDRLCFSSIVALQHDTGAELWARATIWIEHNVDTISQVGAIWQV